MEGSSNTGNMGSNISGGVLIFKNKTCRCGKKAGVKISESFDNPGKLYYICERRQCKFFSWWDPYATELLGNMQGSEELNRVGIDEKLKLLDAKMQKLDSSMIGIMQNQTTVIKSLIGLKKMMWLNMLLLVWL